MHQTDAPIIIIIIVVVVVILPFGVINYNDNMTWSETRPISSKASRRLV